MITEKSNADSVGALSDAITTDQSGAKSFDMETERCPPKKINMVKSRSHSSGSKAHKLEKSTVEVLRDQTCSGTENTGLIAGELGRFQDNYLF